MLSRFLTLSSAAEDKEVGAASAAPTPVQSDIPAMVAQIQNGEPVHISVNDIHYMLIKTDWGEGVEVYWKTDAYGMTLHQSYHDKYKEDHPFRLGYWLTVVHGATRGGESIEQYRENLTRTVLAAIFSGKQVHQLRCHQSIGHQRGRDELR